MNMGPRIATAILTLVLGMLPACAGQGPFLMVQVCLQDHRGVTSFEEIMKSISQSQHMEYGDRSAASQKELTELGASPDYKLINIGAVRSDGVGWGGGNLGLSAYQVAIGFSAGSNPVAAHRFANLVVDLLKQRWHVYVVPAGGGALPLKSCGK